MVSHAAFSVENSIAEYFKTQTSWIMRRSEEDESLPRQKRCLIWIAHVGEDRALACGVSSFLSQRLHAMFVAIIYQDNGSKALNAVRDGVGRRLRLRYKEAQEAMSSNDLE